MQSSFQILDWTIDAAAKIVENDDYVVSFYDGEDGDYDIAYMRAKQAQRMTPADERMAMRDARVAFNLAMRHQRG